MQLSVNNNVERIWQEVVMT